jgi:hypothetical protein
MLQASGQIARSSVSQCILVIGTTIVPNLVMLGMLTEIGRDPAINCAASGPHLKIEEVKSDD